MCSMFQSFQLTYRARTMCRHGLYNSMVRAHTSRAIALAIVVRAHTQVYLQVRACTIAIALFCLEVCLVCARTQVCSELQRYVHVPEQTIEIYLLQLQLLHVQRTTQLCTYPDLFYPPPFVISTTFVAHTLNSLILTMLISNLGLLSQLV